MLCMANETEERAYEDLEKISTESKRALNALQRGDIEEAEDMLRSIQERAEAWEVVE